jgi:peptidoglycan/LPS O-acetylase OafA/YrhL
MPTPAAAKPDHRNAAVDGLRAIAALSVLGYHAWLYSLPVVRAGRRTDVMDSIAHELRLGLVLFFVLSGFLLFRPWVRSALDGTSRPRPFAYLVRRAARIGPAYYAAVLGSIALLWGLDRGTHGLRLPSSGDLWLFGVFGQNFRESTVLRLDPPLWTLAVEVCFYLILPILGWVALRLPHARNRAVQLIVPIAFLAAGVLFNNAIAGENLGIAPTKILPAMAPYFAAGMAAAVLVHGRTIGTRTGILLLVGGALLVLVDARWAYVGAQTGSHDLALRIWRDDPAAVGFAAIVAVAACSAERLPVLTWRPLVWVGLVSYGLYLWHVPLLIWLRGNHLLPANGFGAFALILPIGLAVAAISWRVLERPSQAWARRVTARRRPPSDPAAPDPARAGSDPSTPASAPA